jgi:hypothetical protein
LLPNFYSENAKELSQQYLSMCFDEAHQAALILASIFETPGDIMLKMRTSVVPDLKYLADSVPQFAFICTRLPKNKKGP